MVIQLYKLVAIFQKPCPERIFFGGANLKRKKLKNMIHRAIKNL